MRAGISAKVIPVKITKKTTSATKFRKLVKLSLDRLVKVSLSGKVRATFKINYKIKKKSSPISVIAEIILNQGPKTIQ